MILPLSIRSRPVFDRRPRYRISVGLRINTARKIEQTRNNELIWKRFVEESTPSVNGIETFYFNLRSLSFLFYFVVVARSSDVVQSLLYEIGSFGLRKESRKVLWCLGPPISLPCFGFIVSLICTVSLEVCSRVRRVSFHSFFARTLRCKFDRFVIAPFPSTWFDNEHCREKFRSGFEAQELGSGYQTCGGFCLYI